MNEEITKVQSLEMLTNTKSGYDQLNQEASSEKNYIKFLHLLLTKQNTKLNNYLQENPQLIDSSKHKALFLLNLLVLQQKLQPFHISVREPNPRVVDELAYQLVELYKAIHSLFTFPEIDFYQYKNLMPSIVIYWSDVILRERSDRQDPELTRVYQEINNDENFTKLLDDNLRAQQYRLLALYYRRQGDHQSAEKQIIKYREGFVPINSANYTLNKISPNLSYPANQVLAKLNDIYQESSAIQSEVLTRSGIYEDTCFYYGCADCCTKDFPVVSLVEFLHIRNNLSPEELTRFTKRAKAIQEKHIELYNEPLCIIDQATGHSKEKLDPHHMLTRCPFLGENDACEIHSLRPLACRAFGLSTINDTSVQACKLYLQQYAANADHRNQRDVYDSRPHTAMIGAANTRLASEHGYSGMKQPVGSLVAWLTQKL